MSKKLFQMSTLSVSPKTFVPYAIMTIALQCAAIKSDAVNSTEISPQMLEVKIYYGAMCPDSMRFIHQFKDAMIEKKLFNYTDIKFIPYGRVKTWKDPITNYKYLLCQHGFRECELNALHACIVENNSKMEQLQMIDCLMGGISLQNCIDNLHINVTAALYCKSSRSVADILEKYGEDTDDIGLWFVPSISLDGVLDLTEQKSILEDFAKMFCEKYKQKYNVELDNCNW